MIKPSEARFGLVPLKAGEMINRWEVGAKQSVTFPGQARPMPDTVDYSFGFKREAYSGESTAREALRERGPLIDPKMPAGPYDVFYAGYDEANVDFSRFYYTPTLVTQGFRCHLRTPRGGQIFFRLVTPSNVRIWVNRDLVTQFELTDRPNAYLRNQESHQDFSILVPEGVSEMVLELEQLCERDTSNFFALEYRGGTELYTHVENPDPAGLHQVSDMMATLEADRVFYIDEPFKLTTQCPLPFDLTVDVTSYKQYPRGDSLDAEKPPALSATLKANETEVSFDKEITLPTGSFQVDVQVNFSGYAVHRQIGSTSFNQTIPLSGPNLSERKNEVAKLTANDPGRQPSTAYLLLSQGERGDVLEKIMTGSLLFIEERRDCSDFSLLPLLRVWQDFRDDLSEVMRSRLRKAILDYRYWLNEPGNDVMWFWSENHILCFHICQYLAGNEFPEEVFSNSGWTGRQHSEEAHRRLQRWFDSAELYGLAECNSAAYYPIDMLALLVLHDGTDDSELRTRSSALLDTIFVMAAAHNMGTASAGAMGRTYERELLSGPANELSVCLALAYGGSWVPHFDRVSAIFCCSSYEPPVLGQNLQHLNTEAVLHARYTQGHEYAAKLTLWKSAHAQLSSSTEHMTGQQGLQEHLIDVQFAAHPLARIWVNHPGDLKAWSERRPSKLAGNHALPRVAQHENQCFVIFDLTRVEYSLPFTQLFACPDAFDEIRNNGNWMFARSGAGCAAVWCSVVPGLEGVGLYRATVWRAEATKVAWFIAVGTAKTDGEFDTFCAAHQAAQPSFDIDTLTLAKGDQQLEFEGAFYKAGKEVVFGPLTNTPQFAFGDAPLAAWADMTLG